MSDPDYEKGEFCVLSTMPSVRGEDTDEDMCYTGLG